MSDMLKSSTTINPSQGEKDKSNLNDMYRPGTFAKMFGQESAVTCPSGQVARGCVGRSIQLHGAVGRRASRR